MKKLSEEFKNELNKINLPEGQIGISFLTPTIKDNFIEEEYENKTKITFEKSYMICEIKEEGKYKIHKINSESDYYTAKLIGYLTHRTPYLLAKESNVK